jgi:uncharacterized membrane protein YfcA
MGGFRCASHPLFTSTLAFFFLFSSSSTWLDSLYAWLGLSDVRNTRPLALLPFAPIGVWVGADCAPHQAPVVLPMVYIPAYPHRLQLVWDALAIT